jgi:hypothetical protein
MKTRSGWVASALAIASLPAAHALNPPSSSDGPVKLLSCVVTPAGVLEAAVASQSDDAMSCEIHCTYELGERMFSQTFTVTIPARFQGRVGEFDTNGAKTGNYSGEISACEAVSTLTRAGFPQLFRVDRPGSHRTPRWPCR